MFTPEQRWDALVSILTEADSLVSSPAVQQGVPLAYESWVHFQRRACCHVPLPVEGGEERFMEDLGPLYSDSPPDSLSDNTDVEIADKDILAVIPLYEEDRSIGDLLWTGFLDKRASMAYSPTRNSILLRMDLPETPIFKAINLLHEAGHALRAFQEGRAFAGVFSRLPHSQQIEELEMFKMELDLLSVLGSGPYMDAVQVLAKDLIWKLKVDPAGGLHTDMSLSLVTPLMPLLDNMVGKVPDDPRSCTNRLLTVQLQVAFRVYELIAYKCDWSTSQLQTGKLTVMATLFAR